MSEDRPDDRRRGVTRGYVVGLVSASTIVAVALVVATWGLIGLVSGRAPVMTPRISSVAAEVVVLAAVLLLATVLWAQALVLLRGRRRPPWAHLIVGGLGGYFVWCLGGVLAGLSIEETWLSPFAWSLGVIWAVASLLFWAVLARRVYTDRQPPRWPWERRGDDDGPDWHMRADEEDQ